MNRVDLSDFTRKMSSLSRTYKTLPNEIAAVAVNFSKERFVSQSWLDSTKTKWEPRKRQRKGRGSQTLLVKTGRLKRSVRKILATETQIVIGTDVPYAQIHNDGGKINKVVAVKAHTRNKMGKVKRGTGVFNVRTRKERTRTKTEKVGDIKVKAHTREMNTTIPQRQFIGESYTLTKRITNLIAARFMRALKS
jgi:phage gpG-like protein